MAIKLQVIQDKPQRVKSKGLFALHFLFVTRNVIYKRIKPSFTYEFPTSFIYPE